MKPEMEIKAKVELLLREVNARIMDQCVDLDISKSRIQIETLQWVLNDYAGILGSTK